MVTIIYFPMQKWEKMWERMSGVVMSPVIVARWWMVWRRSWATRSAGSWDLRAEMADVVAWAARSRDW